MGEKLHFPDDQVRDASRRFVQVDVEDDVWTATGGGNRLSKRIGDLQARTLDLMAYIDEEYQPIGKEDRTIYMLHRGLNDVIGLSNTVGWDVEIFVNEKLKRLGSDKRTKRAETFQEADSLALLSNAFNLVGSATAGNEDNIDEFIHGHSSSLWENPNLRAAMIEGLQKANELAQIMTSPERRSVEGLVAKLRYEFIKQGLGWSIPRQPKRDARFQTNLQRGSQDAWVSWPNT